MYEAGFVFILWDSVVTLCFFSIYFKECATELTPSIAELFNASLNSSTVPKAWKQVPIHKKGTKSQFFDYLFNHLRGYRIILL